MFSNVLKSLERGLKSVEEKGICLLTTDFGQDLKRVHVEETAGGPRGGTWGGPSGARAGPGRAAALAVPVLLTFAQPTQEPPKHILAPGGLARPPKHAWSKGRNCRSRV